MSSAQHVVWISKIALSKSSQEIEMMKKKQNMYANRPNGNIFLSHFTLPRNSGQKHVATQRGVSRATLSPWQPMEASIHTAPSA